LPQQYREIRDIPNTRSPLHPRECWDRAARISATELGTTMNDRRSSQRIEALLRAQLHWQTTHAEEMEAAAPPFTIALSREVGAQGTAVGQAVAERLDWPLYDRQLLERIAGELGLRTELLDSVDEKRQGWLQECMKALAAVPAVSSSTYVRQLVDSLMWLASHGKCVIVGRGAAQILPAETTLRVRLVAPLKDRVLVIEKKKALAPEEAGRWVARIDAERVQFVKDHFHKDPTDPRLYDLILNSARFDIDKCANLIVEALHSLRAPPAPKREGLPVRR